MNLNLKKLLDKLFIRSAEVFQHQGQRVVNFFCHYHQAYLNLPASVLFSTNKLVTWWRSFSFLKRRSRSGTTSLLFGDHRKFTMWLSLQVEILSTSDSLLPRRAGGAGSGWTAAEASGVHFGTTSLLLWGKRCRGKCAQRAGENESAHWSSSLSQLYSPAVFQKRAAFFFFVLRVVCFSLNPRREFWNRDKCLAKRLPKAKPRPAARLRAAPRGRGPAKLRGAARASFRWTAWSTPADPPSATAASFMTSLLR